MKTRIVLAIENVHMGLAHDGLASLAKKFKFNVEKLEVGEMILFLNRKRDKLKIYGCNQCLGYYRSPGGRIALEALQYLPTAFSGQATIDLSEAMEKSLRLSIERRIPKGEGATPRIAARWTA